ncbi:Protein of unknown function [Sinomicrobium oceani]|uniref:DUF998 domain-containing protein n=1 Tax=Sinomicrobium oceani TaxID=1150368 RepID=A0A1K1RPV8_9FLAO|nr:Protein of unknown function [Sinomicrobium oceani]
MRVNTLQVAKTAAIGFMGILVLHHFINPDINPGWQPISMYALGKLGWLMNMGFILCGVSFSALGVFVYRHIKTPGGRIGRIFMGIAAIGNFLAGIFNADPMDTLPEQMTGSGSIHAGAAGLLGFFILATLFICVQFLKQQHLRPFKMGVVITTAVVLIAEIIMMVIMGIYLSGTDGILTPETPVGGIGRVVILACLVWVLVTVAALEKARLRTNFN